MWTTQPGTLPSTSIKVAPAKHPPVSATPGGSKGAAAICSNPAASCWKREAEAVKSLHEGLEAVRDWIRGSLPPRPGARGGGSSTCPMLLPCYQLCAPAPPQPPPVCPPLWVTAPRPPKPSPMWHAPPPCTSSPTSDMSHPLQPTPMRHAPPLQPLPHQWHAPPPAAPPPQWQAPPL